MPPANPPPAGWPAHDDSDLPDAGTDTGANDGTMLEEEEDAAVLGSTGSGTISTDRRRSVDRLRDAAAAMKAALRQSPGSSRTRSRFIP